MTIEPTDIDHILVCADASAASRRALDIAQQIAKGVSAKVSAKHVFDVTRVDPELGHFLDGDQKNSLKEAVRKHELNWADVDGVEVELIEGRSVPTLLEMTDDTDLVVVGHSGYRPVSEFLLGSITKHLVASAKCPVLVVQAANADTETDTESIDQKVIVCAVDGSNAATRGLVFAAKLAAAFQTRLEVLTVADVSSVDVYDGFYMSEEKVAAMEARTHRAILDDVRASFEDVEVDHSERIARGRAKKVLLDETNRDDVGVLIIGRTGKGAFEQMLQGSVSQALTAHAGCPVLIVP